MVDGLIARRALNNVKGTDIARRGLIAATKVGPAGFLALGLLWLLPLGAAALAPSLLEIGVSEAELGFYAGQAALTSWSLMTAPALAGLLASPTIRTVGGARLRAGEVWRSAVAAAPVALGAGLAAGVLTTLGFGACVIPGFFLASMWFVAGPVAAIEKRSVGAALTRSAELTSGNRWALAAIVFLWGLLERLFFRLAGVFLPPTTSSSTVETDLASALVLSTVLAAVVSLLRATSSAVAYNDLRTEKEGLEIDAIVEELGGATDSFGDGALSERDIERLAERRRTLGKLTGQKDEEPAVEAIASTRDLEAMAKRRTTRMRLLGAGFAALFVVGLGATLGMGIWGRTQEHALLEEYELEIKNAWASSDAGATPDPAEEHSVAFPEPEKIRKVNRMIARRVQGVRKEMQRPLLYRLLVHHADHYWGPGFAEAFRLASSESSEEEILAALEEELRGSGCQKALAEARGAAKPGKQFVGACPPFGAAMVSPRQVRSGGRLWGVVFATLLEFRAHNRNLDEDEFHRLVAGALLKE